MTSPLVGAWWATVTQVSPLRIQRDGDDAALPITPDSLIPAPPVGTRVWVVQTGRRITVVGMPAGPDAALADPRHIPVLAGFSTITATAWTTVGATGDVTVVRSTLVDVTLGAWMKTFGGGDLRIQVTWSGALVGSSQAAYGWAGGALYLYSSNSTAPPTVYEAQRLSFPLRLPAGTTTFAVQAYTVGAGTSPQISYMDLVVTPKR